MYIKNRRNISEIKAFGSYQIQCVSDSSVLRNRLLFIQTVVLHSTHLGKPRLISIANVKFLRFFENI